MTGDQHHQRDELDQEPGTVHLHVLAQRDEWQRIRVTLTMLHLAMFDEWPSTLARELALDALHQATIASGIEVTAGDGW